MQGGIDLLNIIEHMTLCDEQIFPSVIVKVLQAEAPARTPRTQDAKTCLKAPIRE